MLNINLDLDHKDDNSLVEIHDFNPIIRIEFNGKNAPMLADALIYSGAAAIIKLNPHLKYYPLDIRINSRGHIEGVLTFYEW